MNELLKEIDSLRNSQDTIRRTQAEHDLKGGDLKKKKRELTDRIRALSMKNAGLHCQREHIHRNFNLDDLLGGIDLNSLRGAINGNENVNETIKDLLKKYDNMKQFSREDNNGMN